MLIFPQRLLLKSLFCLIIVLNKKGLEINSPNHFEVIKNIKKKEEDIHGFMKITNGLIKSKNSQSVINFEAQSYFNECRGLSMNKYINASDTTNPIYSYFPGLSLALLKPELPSNKNEVKVDQYQNQKIYQENLMKPKIFRLKFRLDKIPDIKKKDAVKNRNRESYVIPKNFIFREDEILFNQKPFIVYIIQTKFRVAPIENPNFISQHDKRPKEAIENEIQKREIRRKMALTEYEMAIKGNNSKKLDWNSS